GSTDAATTAAPSNGAVLAPSAAVLAAIAGLAEDAGHSALIKAISQDDLTPEVVTAIMSGSFVSSLVDAGAVSIEDGKLVVA
ncbi:hypothetical protein LCGC14_3161670, partial [marine sediment metagenome]